jgi:hypothetical protein
MKALQKTLITATLVGAPAVTLAQSITYGRPIVEALSTVQVIFGILNVLLPAAGVLLFFWLVISFIWNRMKGNTEKGGSSGNLIWGIIALAVIFGVYGLVRLTASFVGVNTDGSTRITAPALPSVSR